MNVPTPVIVPRTSGVPRPVVNRTSVAPAATSAVVETWSFPGAWSSVRPGIRARSKGAKVVIPAVVATSGQWYGVVASKNVAKPEDLVGMLSFLTSDDAAFVTAQTLYVDGGFVRA